MGKKIELKCKVATFKSGSIVEIGNGKDQLKKDIFDTLDDHHFAIVIEKTLANTKDLQSELDNAIARADDLGVKNTGLTTIARELETEKATLITKVDELETANTGLTTKVDELINSIKDIDLTLNAENLRASITELQAKV